MTREPCSCRWRPAASPESSAHPLRAVLAKAQRTSQGDYPAIEIVVVEVTRQRRHRGLGECLARRGAAAYARFDRRGADAAPDRQGSGRPARALEDDARRALGPAGRATGRGDLGGRHRALGHRRQGGGPADPQAARRHGADTRRRLCVLDQLARRRHGRGRGRGCTRGRLPRDQGQARPPAQGRDRAGTLRPQARRRRHRTLCRRQLGL